MSVSERHKHVDDAGAWHVNLDGGGVHFNQCANGTLCSSSEVDGFVEQLVDDGHAHRQGDEVCLPWTGYFSALDDADYDSLPAAVGMPQSSRCSPLLESVGSLTDQQFNIEITGWHDQVGRVVYPVSEGAMLTKGPQRELMSAAQWELHQAVAEFSGRKEGARDPHNNKLGWGKIRQLAIAAEAGLDNFLRDSVVLTPESLQLHMRKSQLPEGRLVVEVEPLFEDAPSKWLAEFDRWPQVRPEYVMTTEEGLVQVLVRPEAQTVLREIKRMPGRRVAGERARAFLHNPYAVLGEDAQVVIDEKQFVAARQEAGLTYDSFAPLLDRDESGVLQRAGLLISAIESGGAAATERKWLSQDRLETFIDALQAAHQRHDPLLAWEGYDLELDSSVGTDLATLSSALLELKAPRQLLSWEDIYDLGKYSDRVKGIGEQEAYYSVYIVKESKSDWVPENLALVIGYVPEGDGERVMVRASDELIEDLRVHTEAARADGRDDMSLPWLPKPMPVDEAVRILTDLAAPIPAQEPDPVDSEAGGAGTPDDEERGKDKPTRQTLLIHTNINQLDYDARRKALEDFSAIPVMPRKLRPKYELFEHQQKGVAWLQHLYKQRQEQDVQGAILADDMGLGKTLQLLAFMAWLFEQAPHAPPALVVAPVSLLQNWREELKTFFEDDALPVLVAYGKHLKELKIPPEAVDRRLQEEAGLVNFLRPRWVGDKKLILTTYETLRSLEFSFARQPWSIMICDEAQKIKNPDAMVTRAAKKQQAWFKVACTGTPVENTLADLWCLFDFVQPGLLGALDEFGKHYRKPIEAKTDEEKQRVDELRERIRSQILRRTKEEVARDLPHKYVDDGCRHLVLSDHQRNLYARAIAQYNKRDDPDAPGPFKHQLVLLQHLRTICTDPRYYGEVASLNKSLADYRVIAPKMDWLIRQLGRIRAQNEKVIIFCEFRQVQRLLRHYIGAAFDLSIDIINGSTTSDPSADGNRQERINAFQRGSGFGVIILSPAAVGFGLNIQAANHVVHYTRVWNPAKEDQATDRAYRIGQKRDVYVYYPGVTADDFRTFDEQLDNLLEYKRGLAKDILNGTGEIGAAEFTATPKQSPGNPSADEPSISVEDTDSFSGRYFEGLVAELWSRQGFQSVILTPSSGDHGVDVVAISSGKGVLIQVKVTSQVSGLGLGWAAVRDVVGGEEFYKQRYPNVLFEKYCVTNRMFNKDAHAQAKIAKVTLVERKRLQKLLKKHSVTRHNVDSRVYV